jgi:protein O-mannosyl-transferase
MRSDPKSKRKQVGPKGASRPAKGQSTGGAQRAAFVWSWPAVLGALMLVALVLATYAPVTQNTFIWDDNDYVTQNLTLRTLPGLRSIWFSPFSLPQYYPLVHTTFWVEYHLWELEPLGYHLVNVLLHATSVLLLCRLLVRLEAPGAWLAAALFAVHPVMVESVAWITERKNVLSLALTLGSMLCYLRFAPATEGTGRASSRAGGWTYYAVAFVLFVLALLSKTVVASMPAVLLVIYWWKRGRIDRRDGARLLPFFIVGIGLGLVTAWLERIHVGAEGADWSFTPVERGLIAGRAVWFYAGKLVWPHPIIFFYPKWDVSAHLWWQYLYPLAALALVAALWLARRRIGRGPLASVLIFGGVLVPALGFLNVYPFRYSFVADHFQYHASLAILALLGAILASVGERIADFFAPTTTDDATPTLATPWARRALLWGPAAVLLASLAALSFRGTHVYFDLHSLYGDIIAKNPGGWAAHLNLGAKLLFEGKKDEAMEQFRIALELSPKQPIAHTNYGDALFDLGIRKGFDPGQLDTAREHFQTALDLEPRWMPAYVGLAKTLIREEKLAEAMKHLTRALELYPNNPPALETMGALLIRETKWSEAIEYFQKALVHRPNLAQSHHGLGLALLNLGRTREALPHLTTSLELDPDSYEAQFALANALMELKEFRTAIDRYNEALRIKPDYLDALSNLAAAYGQLGDADRAMDYCQQVLRIDPDFKSALANLENARELKRQQEEQKTAK